MTEIPQNTESNEAGKEQTFPLSTLNSKNLIIGLIFVGITVFLTVRGNIFSSLETPEPPKKEGEAEPDHRDQYPDLRAQWIKTAEKTPPDPRARLAKKIVEKFEKSVLPNTELVPFLKNAQQEFPDLLGKQQVPYDKIVMGVNAACANYGVIIQLIEGVGHLLIAKKVSSQDFSVAIPNSNLEFTHQATVFETSTEGLAIAKAVYEANAIALNPERAHRRIGKGLNGLKPSPEETESLYQMFLHHEASHLFLDQHPQSVVSHDNPHPLSADFILPKSGSNKPFRQTPTKSQAQEAFAVAAGICSTDLSDNASRMAITSFLCMQKKPAYDLFRHLFLVIAEEKDYIKGPLPNFSMDTKERWLAARKFCTEQINPLSAAQLNEVCRDIVTCMWLKVSKKPTVVVHETGETGGLPEKNQATSDYVHDLIKKYLPTENGVISPTRIRSFLRELLQNPTIVYPMKSAAKEENRVAENSFPGVLSAFINAYIVDRGICALPEYEQRTIRIVPIKDCKEKTWSVGSTSQHPSHIQLWTSRSIRNLNSTLAPHSNLILINASSRERTQNGFNNWLEALKKDHAIEMDPINIDEENWAKMIEIHEGSHAWIKLKKGVGGNTNRYHTDRLSFAGFTITITNLTQDQIHEALACSLANSNHSSDNNTVLASTFLNLVSIEESYGRYKELFWALAARRKWTDKHPRDARKIIPAFILMANEVGAAGIRDLNACIAEAIIATLPADQPEKEWVKKLPKLQVKKKSMTSVALPRRNANARVVARRAGRNDKSKCLTK